jgi:cytochrome c oxidase subunit II
MRLLPPQRPGSPGLAAGDRTVKASSPRASSKYPVIFGVLTLGLLLLACQPDAPQSTFGPAGPVAQQQLQLFNVALWIMVAVFVLVEGALLYAAIRFRRRPGQGLPRQIHGNTPLEITWTIIPTILILGLGVWSVFVLFDLQNPPAMANPGNPSEPLEVTVRGHQWWWEFEYLDADGEGKHITTANEMRIPVGRPVILHLRSDDVIHSFWVPRLAGKTDVIPTRQNRMWIQADETGTFHGQCAEFCGIAHAQMKFLVHSLTEEDYDNWVEGYGRPPQLSAQAQRGQQVFNSVGGCLVCHTTTGPDQRQVVEGRVQGWLAGGPIAPGPNLTDLGLRDTLGAGLLDLNRENLRRWLNDPESIKPGNRMTDRAAAYQTSDGHIRLNQAQVSDLIEYLLSLR